MCDGKCAHSYSCFDSVSILVPRSVLARWGPTSVCKLTAAADAAVTRMLADNKKHASNRHSAVQKQAAVLPPPPTLDNDDDLGLDRLLGITAATVANKVIATTMSELLFQFNHLVHC